ncbi:hypothetical protein ACFPM7_28365 [Actinokineospora guangxiensis]|uniref:Uncharacterized protein n=1 Tax=Actinokineospora guangxiensis TaxID=1490288 RepID=A0ABW0EW68_9PSEU
MTRVEPTADGFRVVGADGRAIELAWADVVAVSAYAVDAIVHVVRHLDFALVDGSAIEVSAQVDGWEVVLDGIACHLAVQVADVAAAIGSLSPDGDVQTVALAR